MAEDNENLPETIDIPEQPQKASFFMFFDSASDYLNDKPNDTWRNSGYLTQGVARSTVFKVGADILRFMGNLDGTNGFGLGTILVAFGGPIGLVIGAGLILNAVANFVRDPVGFFKNAFKRFGRGGRTTRYYYHYIQSCTQINGQYLPDPISTYAGMAVANKTDIAQFVQNQLKTGKGHKLKKYHQYYTHRYKNRRMTWRAYQTATLRPFAIVFDEETFESTLPTDRRYIKVHQNMDFEKGGEKYQEYIQKTYGYDIFNSPAGDTPDENSDLESIGVTYWSSPLNPAQVNKLEVGIGFTDNIPNSLSNLSIGQSIEKEFTSFFNSPYSKSSSVDTEDDNGNDIIINKEVLVKLKITYLGTTTVNNQTKHQYHIEEIQETYEYDKEHFFWVDPENNTNSQDFLNSVTITPRRQIFTEPLTSENSKMYKFYAPIPIEDWKSGNWNIIQIIPDMTKHQGLVTAMKELSNLTSKIYDGIEENVEADSSVGEKTQAKATRKKQKGSGSVNINGKSVKRSERALQRMITRNLQRSHKIKANADKLADVKNYRPRRLKRHLELLSDYLGIDYNQHVAQQMATDYWRGGYGHTNTFHTSIMPAAIFSNQSSDNAEYWYQWAKREYQNQGRENSRQAWLQAVQSAGSLNSLPQNVVKFTTTDGLHYGGFSYLFITKMVIDGSTRKIKKKRRNKDILRGRPISIGSIDMLKQMPEPLRELASDDWYQSKNGKQYPIGGARFSGTGVTESAEPNINICFDNFSYTYFCKNLGKGKIACYAVAGLQFNTRAIDRNFWCAAWRDLGMEFERNKQKYVDRKPSNDIQVYHELETGGRKYYYINRLYNFGIVPLDYNVIRRMPARALENFAQRAPLNYSWLFVEQKKKRSGLKYVSPVIQIVGFIVSIILAPFTAGQSLWINVIINVAIAVAVAVIMKIAFKYILMPFFRMIGLKGIVALIILIIIVVVIAMLTGSNATDSVMPQVSEVAAETANQVGNQVAQESVKEVSKEFTMEAIKESLKEIPKQFTKELTRQLVGATAWQTGIKAFGLAAQGYQEIIQEQMNQVEAEYKAELQKFNEAFEELEQMQEDLQSSMPNWDTTAILRQYANPQKWKELDTMLEGALVDLGQSASLDYIWTVLDFKTSVDPTTYDPIESIIWKV